MTLSLNHKLRKLLALQQAIDVNLLVSIADRDGKIKAVNERFCEVFKYNEEELLGRDHRLLNSGYHPREFFEDLWTTITTGRIWHGEIKNKCKDGTFYWLDTVIVPVFNHRREIDEFVSIRVLINEKKEVELTLKEMHARTSGLFNAITDMVTISQPSGKRVYANENFCRFFGVTEEEALKMLYVFQDEGADPEDYLRQLAALSKEEPTISNAHLLKNACGENKWILWSETGIFDGEGNCKEILSIGRDITELKDNEGKIKKNLKELQLLDVITRSSIMGEGLDRLVKVILSSYTSLIPSALARYFAFDKDKECLQLCCEKKGREVVTVSENFTVPLDKEALTKLRTVYSRNKASVATVDEMLAKVKYADHFWYSDLQELKKKYGQVYVVTALLSSGEEIAGMIMLATVHQPGCDEMQSLDRISTQAAATISKINAEQEIINQKQFHETVLNNLPADIAVFNDQFQYVFINDTAVKDEGLRKWLIGKTDYDYCNYRNLDTGLADTRRRYLEQALQGRQVQHVEEIINTSGETKYLLRIIYPLMANNKVTNLVGYGMDITSMKKAEKEKDEHVKQLEDIAFATSHKIRQPLVNLQGIFNMIEAGEVSDAELPEMLGLMRISLQQMDKLTKELGANLYEYKSQLVPA